jgi:hypothetical protein
MLAGTPAEILLQASLALGPASTKEVVARSRLDADAASQALSELANEGRLIPLETGDYTFTAYTAMRSLAIAGV